MHVGLFALLIPFAALTVTPGRDERAVAPPNIVVILVDDLGYGDLGSDVSGIGGRADHRTPRIAGLAKESRVFTHAYSAAPNCAPSRASLQTGRYTPRHGVITVGSSARGKPEHRALIPVENVPTLAPDELTLAERLDSGRYASAHLGKWHLGDDPRTQGYDINVGGTARGHPKSYFSPYQNPALEDGPEGESLTTRLTDEAIERLDELEEPFFVHLAYYTVHTPLQGAPARVAERRENEIGEQRRAALHYGAMVEGLDAEVGRLLDALEDRGLHENTVVVFTSDNGGYGPVTNHDVLRGFKGTLDEGGVRVPLFVRWPGKITPGVDAMPVHHVDLLPTFEALAGLEDRDDAIEIDGVDLSTRLLAPVSREAPFIERGTLFWHFPAYLQGRSDRFEHFRTKPGSSMRKGDWKLIEYFEPRADGSPWIELYNLAVDPLEANDLAGEDDERTEAMRSLLERWRSRIGAKLPSLPEVEDG